MRRSKYYHHMIYCVHLHIHVRYMCMVSSCTLCRCTCIYSHIQCTCILYLVCIACMSIPRMCTCIYIVHCVRYIIRLLEDLIFFVICKETSQATQRPSALTEEGVPERDRQKLIREQEVLKEVRKCGRWRVGGGWLGLELGMWEVEGGRWMVRVGDGGCGRWRVGGGWLGLEMGDVGGEGWEVDG